MFTHLHLHTDYSLLDGMGQVKQYVRKAKELGFESLAITDQVRPQASLISTMNVQKLESSRYLAARFMKRRYQDLIRLQARMIRTIII